MPNTSLTSCCRVCLKREKVMLPLVSKPIVEYNFTYYDMLNFCINTTAIVGDNIPSRICLICKSKMETTFRFKKLAEKSEQRLSGYLPSATAKKKKVKFDNVKDLKRKIDIKVVDDKSHVADSISILDSESKIDICNTSIRKVCSKKGNDSSDSIVNDDIKSEFVKEEDDDDDDNHDYDYDSGDMPLITLKKPKKEEKQIEVKVLAPVHGFPRIVRIDNYQKKYSSNNAIRIKNKFDDSIMTHIPLNNKISARVVRLAKRPGKNIRVECPIKVKDSYGDWDTDQAVRVERLRNRTPRQKEKMVCPVCGILTYTLSKHLLSHEENKPFTCEECNKSFAYKLLHSMHMKKHTGVKDQICDVCGAAFYFKKSLVRHMLIHNSPRPFLCNLCPKKFIANCDLTRHKKVHAGYKPYQCESCPMAFQAKHQLQNHTLIHTGVKPFACEVCNILFTYKVNLNNHVFKVHGVNIRYKPIHKVTKEILSQEYELSSNSQPGKSVPLIMFDDS